MISVVLTDDEAVLTNNGEEPVDVELVSGWARHGSITLDPGEERTRKVVDQSLLEWSYGGDSYNYEEDPDGMRLREEVEDGTTAGSAPEPSDAVEQSVTADESMGDAPSAVTGPLPAAATIASAVPPPGAHVIARGAIIPGYRGFTVLSRVVYPIAVDLVHAGKAVRVDNPNTRRPIPLWGEHLEGTG